jgi:broad specificity phosphatase PhoE
MNKLICIVARHGCSEGNEKGIFRSQKDYKLTQEGIDQAHAAKKFIKKFNISLAMCSSLSRALDTARIIASNWNLYVFQERTLLPWNTGCFTDLNKDENQDALQLFINSPEIVIPNGESLDAFEERQFNFWNSFLKEDKSGLPLVVCHNSVITSLVKFIDGKETDLAHKEIVRPGGVLGVYRNGNKFTSKVLFGEAEPESFSGS